MAVTLEDVKRELNITWSDVHTDESVQAIWKRAENIIQRAAGRSVDFAEDAFARQLLFDCCRYIFSDAFAQFKTDYAEELLSLHLEAKEDGGNAETTS